MTGYTPAEQDRRAQLGLPYATGADDPPAWHDRPFEGASDTGLPDAAAVAVTPEWWRP